MALHGGHILDHAIESFTNVISDEFLPIYWDGESDFVSKEISFIDKELQKLMKKFKDISERALSLINNSQLEVEKIKIDLLKLTFR